MKPDLFNWFRHRPFFDKNEQEILTEAIRKAENRTSGEIRVHVENKKQVDDPYLHAIEIFEQLGMTATKQANGVLLYINPKTRQVVILGDKGINEKVPKNFWKDEKEQLVEHFKRDDYVKGVSKCIADVGEKLKEFFPYEDDDKNELSDTISQN